MKKEINHFIQLSKYAGARCDLVQAKGGNVSVKLDHHKMMVKASGWALSEMDVNKGFVFCDYQKIITFLKEQKETSVIDEQVIDSLIQDCCDTLNEKPSIELFFHAFLYKYTLHTHPIVVNGLVASYQWKEVLSQLFPEGVIFIPYRKPGIALAITIQQEIDNFYAQHKVMPKITFLQNHGLIVSNDDFEEVCRITDRVTLKIEKYFNTSYEAYRTANKIANMLNEVTGKLLIAYLSCDAFIENCMAEHKEFFFKENFCPDGFVFCGEKILYLDALEISQFKIFIGLYGIPKIMIYMGKVYCIADNVKKARDVEEVLRFHLQVYALNGENIRPLSQDAAEKLLNWEWEKYRQQK